MAKEVVYDASSIMVLEAGSGKKKARNVYRQRFDQGLKSLDL